MFVILVYLLDRKEGRTKGVWSEGNLRSDK
jgi:hypothetical protein